MIFSLSVFLIFLWFGAVALHYTLLIFQHNTQGSRGAGGPDLPVVILICSFIIPPGNLLEFW